MTDKKEIYKIFDDIAPRYELANHILSCYMDLLWRRKAAAKLPKGRELKVLDLCCGSGAQTIPILKNCDKAYCVGIDLSEKLLAIAKKKIEAKGYSSRTEFIKADATQLPFNSNYFDFATVSFGIRNIYDLQKSFKETLRTLKPGGIYIILEFAKPEKSLFSFLFSAYLRYAVPLTGFLLSRNKDAYVYLKESIEAFGKLDISKELITAGFSKTNEELIMKGALRIYSAEKTALPIA